MKDYFHEYAEGLYEELENRVGLKIANEIMKAVRLNVEKRMAEEESLPKADPDLKSDG